MEQLELKDADKPRTAIEAAKVLKVHPNTLRKLANDGNIPAVRVGKRWRFVLSTIVDRGINRDN